MRETIVLILLGILLAVASYQTGYINGDKEANKFQEMAYKQKDQIRNLLGRVEILEGPTEKKKGIVSKSQKTD